jgi:hypothetical protein
LREELTESACDIPGRIIKNKKNTKREELTESACDIPGRNSEK